MDNFLPRSPLLNEVIEGRLAVEGSLSASQNLQRVIALMQDDDPSNRDWATFIVSHTAIDTAEIRDALHKAVDDSDLEVRDEAILGLARREPLAAISLLKPLLKEGLGHALLEAAAIVAHPTPAPALEALRSWTGGREGTQDRLETALEACRSGVPADQERKVGQPHYLLSRS